VFRLSPLRNSLVPLAGLVLVACAPAASPSAPAPAAPRTAGATVAPQPTAPVPPAAAAPSGYDKPPSPLLDVLHSPAPPSPYVSPNGSKILLISTLEYPSMARVAEPYLKLAGVRLEPRNRSRHDTPGGYGIRPCARELSIAAVPSGAETKVTLPADACPYQPMWSPDGSRVVFQNAAKDAVELWVIDAGTGAAKRIEGVKLNPMLGNPIDWLADGKSVLVKAVPDGMGPPPPAPPVPLGPSIQETKGDKGQSSTYENRDTLKDKHDEDLFDYYGASQLATVELGTGAVKKVGKPGIIRDIDSAPDGVHVLVETLKKPYSYVTTFDRFAHDVTVMNLAKNDLHPVASLPLADRVPIHGVPTGPRGFSWRATEPATLVWAEALDKGDWNVKVPARDRVVMHKAPFAGEPVEIVKTEQRFSGFQWGTSPTLAFLHEFDENRHWRRTFTMNVDDPKQKPKVLFDLSSDEKYKNPGGFVMHRLPTGVVVVRQEGDAVFLSGAGASPEGDRPFLDRLDLKTNKKERLFRSDKTALESFLAFTDAKSSSSFLTWHQSPADPPNAHLRTVDQPLAAAAPDEAAFVTSTKPVTRMPDPTPAVRSIKKRLVKYKRKDGVDLSFTLYTPPDYKEGTRVPAILYAYPLDYADSKQAGQVSGSEQTFTRLRQYKLLLLAGYAIIDSAAFPIVGDPKKAYDTYLEQLVADAKAAVDKAVELGVVDPERIGVTGHSHGALMTANLLAHSDLFRAGVATSGSYNKTLTPFGFQNERRSVWEAQSVYLKASTFFYADKLKLPILIMHGADDANPGTTPLQAQKLYEAVRGNGGTARLVMLPNEPHWYTAMESNEQMVAEMLKWFDRHVKNAQPREKGAAAAKPVAAAKP
jgi:dipeptidyl aminopeptidase/acylaminoacyl peptidase